MKLLASLLLSAVLVGACRSDMAQGNAALSALPAAPAESVTHPGAPYRFDRPIASFTLPDELKEISALTVLDDTHLGALQDEAGQLFILSIETGEVVAVVPFAGPGDYEGVELADGRLFVLRSDGVLTELEGWQGGTSSAQAYALELPTDCDAEGLGYDASNGRLLIACKEGGLQFGNRKAVYALRLADWSLENEPAFIFDARAIDGDDELKPSALAVHPVTGEVVVLSSKLPVLLALPSDGSPAQTWDLAAAGFEQPEALAFLPGGDLFIASEGDKEPPVLQRFAYESDAP